jgi:Flp pilus assembly protein TadD
VRSTPEADIEITIGLAFLQQEQSDLAIENFSLAAEYSPDSAAARNFPGRACLRKGRRDRALEF